MDLPPLPTYVDFKQPFYLLLLVAIPVIAFVGYRSFTCLGSFRQKAAIVVRCLLMTLVVVALADPYWVRTTDDQTVIFMVDQSASVPTGLQQDAVEFVRAATKAIRPGKDCVAGMGFAGEPRVWQLPKPQLELIELPPAEERDHTDISAAMKTCLGLFPALTAKRLVLISDGNENRGDSSEIAQSYAAHGIPVDVLPLRYKHDAEIVVERLSAPVEAERDEVVELQLFVSSQQEAESRLLLYHNDAVVDLDPDSSSVSLPVRLRAGANRFSLPIQLATTGVHQFQVMVQPTSREADTLVTNNQSRAFTIVGQAQRVLVVTDAASRESDDGDALMLIEALSEGGIDAEQIYVGDLPHDPSALVDCSALILSNVSAFSLGESTQNMIASFVRDQGGGLIAVGGDQSFSVGAYAGTPLEEILPVQTDRDRLKMLSLAMVIVIDRSGSMAGHKLTMARLAANGSVRMLGPLDRLGVVGFDDQPEWVVPLSQAAERDRITNRISRISAGGGTNMYPALRQAYVALARLNTNLKHMIVLTDGQSMPGDFERLAGLCADAGITVSTIAVGQDADQALLTKIASLAQGRMYVAETARPLPQIFVHETVLVSRTGMHQKRFIPRMMPASDERILVGFTQDSVPALDGYVITAAKPMAATPLVRATQDGVDPIVAYWQTGLGRTVAFTSGQWTRWGSDWASWSGFSKFWTQAVRYAGRSGDPCDLDIETYVKNGEGVAVVSAEHLPRHVQSSLNLAGQLILPDYSSEPLELRRTSLGRFEASFPADTPGTYLVNLAYSHDQGSGQRSSTLRSGAIVSYSQEYAMLKQNESTLARISRSTGGRLLDPSQPEAVFEPWSIRPIEVRRPIWDLLIRMMLPLFLLDVAVRRLAVAPIGMYVKVIAWVDGLVGKPVGGKSIATLATLRESRLRSQESNAPAREEQPATSISDLPSTLGPVETSLNQMLNGPSDTAVTGDSLEQETQAKSGDEYGHTSRLLKAKRKMRDK